MPGIIEAFYGPLWSDDERRVVIDTLGRRGFSFYHYAPKADPEVRENWRHGWTDDRARALIRLREDCQAVDMAFGLGLSPVGLQRRFSDSDRRDLHKRLEQINEIAPDHLVILFDDERGDVRDLAERQALIMDFVGLQAEVDRLYCCPTYFSDAPLLDELFGARPDGYLEELGRRLDPAVRIYWTGPKVCSDTLPSRHLDAVAERLGRRPALWDNYPVNDSPAMIRHLHLRAPTHAYQGIEQFVSDHACNPALQPHLSLIPLLTLTPAFRFGQDRSPETAFRMAAESVVGPEMAGKLETDLSLLQDRGLDALSQDEIRALRQRYETFDQPAAREIVRWLDGGYETSAELAPDVDKNQDH